MGTIESLPEDEEEVNSSSSPQTHVRHSISSVSAPRQSSFRRRAVGKDGPPNIPVLKGHILGEAHTGKTALLCRLRGQDPFQEVEQASLSEAIKNDAVLIPWRAPPCRMQSSIQSCGRVKFLIVDGPPILVPQKEGDKAPGSDTRANNDSSDFERQKMDFLVIVVDPRRKHAVEKAEEISLLMIRQYYATSDTTFHDLNPSNIKTQLPIIFLLNFRDSVDLNRSKEEKSIDNDRMDLTTIRVQKLMIKAHENYLQLLQSTCQSKISLIEKNPEKEESNLHRQLILRQHVIKMMLMSQKESRQLVFQIKTSMKNCFGLQALHTFLRIPYIQFKEQDALLNFCATRFGEWPDHETAVQAAINDNLSSERGYAAFEKRLSQKFQQQQQQSKQIPLNAQPLKSHITGSENNDTSHTNENSANGADTKTAQLQQEAKELKEKLERLRRLQNSGAGLARMLDQRNDTISEFQPSQKAELKVEATSRPQNESQKERFSKFAPAPKHKLMDPKGNMEAQRALDLFLADDDSSEETKHTHGRQKQRVQHQEVSSGESEDDDEDIFYDEGGLRVHAKQQISQPIQSSNKDIQVMKTTAETSQPNNTTLEIPGLPESQRSGWDWEDDNVRENGPKVDSMNEMSQNNTMPSQISKHSAHKDFGSENSTTELRHAKIKLSASKQVQDTSSDDENLIIHQCSPVPRVYSDDDDDEGFTIETVNNKLLYEKRTTNQSNERTLSFGRDVSDEETEIQPIISSSEYHKVGSDTETHEISSPVRRSQAVLDAIAAAEANAKMLAMQNSASLLSASLILPEIDVGLNSDSNLIEKVKKKKKKKKKDEEATQIDKKDHEEKKKKSRKHKQKEGSEANN